MGENLTNYFRTQFEKAHRYNLMSRFVEADDICFQLLREPYLPLLYRAGCNLLLSFGNDNPVDFAKEAVKWYQEMYDEVRDDPQNGPHHFRLLDQARDAVIDAERRVAAGLVNLGEGDESDEGEEETHGAEETSEAEHEKKGGTAMQTGEDTENIERLTEIDVDAEDEQTERASSPPANFPSSSFDGRTVVAEDTTVAGIGDEQKKVVTSDDDE